MGCGVDEIVPARHRESRSETGNRNARPRYEVHKGFVAKLNDNDVRTNALPKASPNLNGRCERVIQTIKQECLSRFVVFGKHHLDHLVRDFLVYYNKHRTHSARDSLPPIRTIPQETELVSIAEVEVKSYVGGLVKSFGRKAA